jgi:hypothetical protein
VTDFRTVPEIFSAWFGNEKFLPVVITTSTDFTTVKVRHKVSWFSRKRFEWNFQLEKLKQQ